MSSVIAIQDSVKQNTEEEDHILNVFEQYEEEDDDILYIDMFAPIQTSKISELEEKVKYLTKELESEQQKNETLHNKKESLQQERETLVRNISSLYKTAKLELGRKDKTISDLRKQVSELLANFKPDEQKPALLVPPAPRPRTIRNGCKNALHIRSNDFNMNNRNCQPTGSRQPAAFSEAKGSLSARVGDSYMSKCNSGQGLQSAKTEKNHMATIMASQENGHGNDHNIACPKTDHGAKMDSESSRINNDQFSSERNSGTPESIGKSSDRENSKESDISQEDHVQKLSDENGINCIIDKVRSHSELKRRISDIATPGKCEAIGNHPYKSRRMAGSFESNGYKNGILSSSHGRNLQAENLLEMKRGNNSEDILKISFGNHKRQRSDSPMSREQLSYGNDRKRKGDSNFDFESDRNHKESRTSKHSQYAERGRDRSMGRNKSLHSKYDSKGESQSTSYSSHRKYDGDKGHRREGREFHGEIDTAKRASQVHSKLEIKINTESSGTGKHVQCLEDGHQKF